MNRPPNLEKRAFNKLRADSIVERRGFNRGARESWKARNNRKINRIAART